jgi:hypothetical protein
MAKILKVKLTTIQVSPTHLHSTAPPEYDATKCEVIAQESQISATGRAAVIARAVDIGGVMTSDDYRIITVKDVDAPAFLASSDITELTEAEANTLGNQWFIPTTHMADPVKVMEIVEKYRTGGTPTANELKAIDPDDAAIGINRKTYNQKQVRCVNKIAGQEA